MSERTPSRKADEDDPSTPPPEKVTDPAPADTGLLGGVDEANEDLDAFPDDELRGAGSAPEGD
jgi:hypothetical protein